MQPVDDFMDMQEFQQPVQKSGIESVLLVVAFLCTVAALGLGMYDMNEKYGFEFMGLFKSEEMPAQSCNVLSVGDNFVIMDAGRENDLQIGLYYEITSDSNKVGAVKIVQIEKTYSVGKFVGDVNISDLLDENQNTKKDLRAERVDEASALSSQPAAAPAPAPAAG